jgi:hypothetical protein
MRGSSSWGIDMLSLTMLRRRWVVMLRSARLLWIRRGILLPTLLPRTPTLLLRLRLVVVVLLRPPPPRLGERSRNMGSVGG